MRKQLVIFDWDGTLADSTAHIVDCIKVACMATDEPFPGATAAKEIIGLGMREALTQLFGQRSETFVQTFRRAYSSHFFSAPMSRADLFDGVVEMLENLSAQGFSLAVATGKSRHGMERALRELDLENAFAAIRCADETQSKPNPQMLHELLAEFKLQPAEAVMIGDTEYDMAMAQTIDMPRIAVTYGAHHIARLQTYQPMAVVESPGQLVKVLTGVSC